MAKKKKTAATLPTIDKINDGLIGLIKNKKIDERDLAAIILNARNFTSSTGPGTNNGKYIKEGEMVGDYISRDFFIDSDLKFDYFKTNLDGNPMASIPKDVDLKHNNTTLNTKITENDIKHLKIAFKELHITEIFKDAVKKGGLALYTGYLTKPDRQFSLMAACSTIVEAWPKNMAVKSSYMPTTSNPIVNIPASPLTGGGGSPAGGSGSPTAPVTPAPPPTTPVTPVAPTVTPTVTTASNKTIKYLKSIADLTKIVNGQTINILKNAKDIKDQKDDYEKFKKGLEEIYKKDASGEYTLDYNKLSKEVEKELGNSLTAGHDLFTKIKKLYDDHLKNDLEFDKIEWTTYKEKLDNYITDNNEAIKEVKEQYTLLKTNLDAIGPQINDLETKINGLPDEQKKIAEETIKKIITDGKYSDGSELKIDGLSAEDKQNLKDILTGMSELKKTGTEILTNLKAYKTEVKKQYAKIESVYKKVNKNLGMIDGSIQNNVPAPQVDEETRQKANAAYDFAVKMSQIMKAQQQQVPANPLGVI